MPLIKLAKLNFTHRWLPCCWRQHSAGTERPNFPLTQHSTCKMQLAAETGPETNDRNSWEAFLSFSTFPPSRFSHKKLFPNEHGAGTHSSGVSRGTGYATENWILADPSASVFKYYKSPGGWQEPSSNPTSTAPWELPHSSWSGYRTDPSGQGPRKEQPDAKSKYFH